MATNGGHARSKIEVPHLCGLLKLNLVACQDWLVKASRRSMYLLIYGVVQRVLAVCVLAGAPVLQLAEVGRECVDVVHVYIFSVS